MKEFILTMLCVMALSAVNATQPGTYHVDAQGSVTVGASKLSEIDEKCSIIKCEYQTESSLKMPGVQYMILR